MNKEIDLMRSQEYKKMKKEEMINMKKNENKNIYKKSKFNKGYILPFNNELSNSDKKSLIIVNILPEYSSAFSTKERVPVKLTCECIELGEAESEYFFDLYDNNEFFESHNDYANSKEDNVFSSSFYKSNFSDLLTQQLSIIVNTNHIKLWDKWKNLEKTMKTSEQEPKKKLKISLLIR